MQTNIAVVQPDMVEDLWSIIYPLLQPAIDDDLFMEETAIKKSIEDNKRALFAASVEGTIVGAAVVDIREAKNVVATIILLGGVKIANWGTQMNDYITAFAKDAGCRYVMAYGQKAWERIWPDFQSSDRTYFYKEIE